MQSLTSSRTKQEAGGIISYLIVLYHAIEEANDEWNAPHGGNGTIDQMKHQKWWSDGWCGAEGSGQDASPSASLHVRNLPPHDRLTLPGASVHSAILFRSPPTTASPSPHLDQSVVDNEHKIQMHSDDSYHHKKWRWDRQLHMIWAMYRSIESNHQ